MTRLDKSSYKPAKTGRPKNHLLGWLGLLLIAIVMAFYFQGTPVSSAQSEICAAPFYSITVPLNDLGPNEYIRPTTGATGYVGGLYLNGSNEPPAAHHNAGLAAAGQITPLDSAGNPDPVNGKIVLVSIGMSNTDQEFRAFMTLVAGDPNTNPQLVIVNGARGSLAAHRWADPTDVAWESTDDRLEKAGVTPQQVQVAWVKLAQFNEGDFPVKAQALQADLENVARNLKARYPNTEIAYYSSRTRAYVYWDGLSPESTAFETAFAVRWMIEKQIAGDSALNFDAGSGSVVAPYLLWGPYLWIDGLNPRSDGRVWTQEDVEDDCTHPSSSGEQKVAEMLLDFFKTDETAVTWFLSDTPVATSTPGSSPTPTASATWTPVVTATVIVTGTATWTPAATATATPAVTSNPPEPTATPTSTPRVRPTDPTPTPKPTREK